MWVGLAEPIDRQLSPLGLAAMDVLAPREGETVLDIGCGTGQTVLQLAERVGPQGCVVGVDISSAMLDVARSHATGLPNASFIEVDATRLDLPSASVDAIYSRFGVMAFTDPPAAFANLRRMLVPGGRLAFVSWRALNENEIDHLPLRAAGLDNLVDPIPFSLEDPAHVTNLLTRTGFRDVAIRPLDEAVSAGDLEASLAVLTGVGALGRILRENPALRAAAEPKVRVALQARLDRGEIWLGAACWIVTARV